MNIVLQRVSHASVTCASHEVTTIGRGVVILAGFNRGDTEATVSAIAQKILALRIFEDEAGKMNRALGDVNGEMLVVPNFTLIASLRKGNRPSFDSALTAERAEELFNHFGDLLATRGLIVRRGVFGEHMTVDIANNGPVTFILDSNKLPKQ